MPRRAHARRQTTSSSRSARASRRELRTFLSEAGLLATTLCIPEGLNNTYALLDFVAWCVTGIRDRAAASATTGSRTGRSREWVAEEERETFAAAFAEAGAFVFTIGLAEVWQDRETGGVFWRASRRRSSTRTATSSG